MPLRIGTAGWSIPRSCADRMPEDGTHLQRYAARLTCAEINSSFHRPHRASTYARWAARVPEDFRFSVKLPKTITHERRFEGCDALLAEFADQVAELGAKRGPILIQLPPSFAFPGQLAIDFLMRLTATFDGPAVIEPRHSSWYAPEVDEVLTALRLARVAADPAVPQAAAEPGGWKDLTYYRLHGAPRVYWSAYDADAITAQAQRLASAPGEVWTIYDNTASGAALGNALDLLARVQATRSPVTRAR